mgnify:CR=1 FL=1
MKNKFAYIVTSNPTKRVMITCKKVFSLSKLWLCSIKLPVKSFYEDSPERELDILVTGPDPQMYLYKLVLKNDCTIN